MHSKVWGKYQWRMMHIISYTYNGRMNEKERQRYISFYKTILAVIPCPVCSAHYAKRLKRYPVEGHLKDKDSLASWVNFLHNEVNYALQKPIVSKSQSDLMYFKDNKLQYDFNDIYMLCHIYSMNSNINYESLKKLLTLFYQIYPNLSKKTPKSLADVKNINNSLRLKHWADNFINEINNKKIIPKSIPTIIEKKKENPRKTFNLGKKENKDIHKNLTSFLKDYKII